jgi:flagellar biosynthesis protein FlhB
MAEEDSAQEKTERATPRRQQQAREQGTVVRSRELGTMAMTLAGAAGVLFAGEDLVARLAGSMRQSFQPSRAQIFDAGAMPVALAESVMSGLAGIAPLLGLFVVVAILSSVAVGGLSFSVKAMGFKWERLDPVAGMGRVFSIRGFIELLKSMAKFALVGAVAVWWLRGHAGEFLGLADEPLEAGMVHAASLLAWSFVVVSAGTILIAMVDVPVQVWQYRKQMRMSHQELRDELKETEGKPEMRARIRRMQREMASRRMMQEVPKADVIVTNPTHYAVALKYDAGRMRAPRVVAKGADLVAVAIRRLGETSRVPVFSAPPLARALYFSTEIGREIPTGLYHAVAQVLAYVFQVRQPRATGMGDPVPPADLRIPPELRRDL